MSESELKNAQRAVGNPNRAISDHNRPEICWCERTSQSYQKKKKKRGEMTVFCQTAALDKKPTGIHSYDKS